MKKIFRHLLSKILRYLSIATLKRYDPCIIGVTGNVGKTSTREAIAHIVRKDRTVRSSLKNFNNELGLPLSIISDSAIFSGLFFWINTLVKSFLSIIIKKNNYPEVLVLEYGVDHPNDMKQLLDIARPHIGVFTAIGEFPVHLEFFNNIDSLFREKAKLINLLPSTGFAILNADDDRIFSLKETTRARVISFGFSERAQLRISNFKNFAEANSLGVSFKISYQGNMVPFSIHGLLGESSAYAVAAAISVGLLFNINLLDASQLFSNFSFPKGRKNILKGIKQSLIIDDTYNAAPLAVEEALTVLKSIPARRKIAVLGDMLELGPRTFEAHEKIGNIARKSADVLFVLGVRGKIIGDSAIKAGMPSKKVFFFTNVHELGMQLSQKVEKGDVILVKGSQAVRMERVVKLIMLDSARNKDLLVRQEPEWLRKNGLYD